jgi:hypothetical protein
VAPKSFEVVAYDQYRYFALEEQPRVFSDGDELLAFMRSAMGFDDSYRDGDGGITGGRVISTFLGYPLAIRVEYGSEPLDTNVELYYVRDPSLAVLGGWSGNIEVAGASYCIDEDGECSGIPSYLVPANPDPGMIKNRIVHANGIDYEMRGESYRTRWWFFVFYAGAGSKTEALGDLPPGVDSLSLYIVAENSSGHILVMDPWGVRGDPDYKCWKFPLQQVSGYTMNLYVCVLA